MARLDYPLERDALEALSRELGGRAGAVVLLGGGVASAMHKVEVVSRSGVSRHFVVRLPSDSALKRMGVEREFRLLERLRERGVPVPEPVKVDAKGRLFGRPALVLGFVEGAVEIEPRDPEPWMRELATTLVALHEIEVEDEDRLLLVSDTEAVRETRTWVGQQSAAHPRARDVADRLDTLLEALAERGDFRESILHGDFWPGNLVWRNGKITAILDWEEPARGEPAMDVAIARLDVAWIVGLEAADRFTEIYGSLSGRRFHGGSTWDIAAAARALPDPARWVSAYHDLGSDRITPDRMRDVLERFLGDALRGEE